MTKLAKKAKTSIDLAKMVYYYNKRKLNKLAKGVIDVDYSVKGRCLQDFKK